MRPVGSKNQHRWRAWTPTEDKLLLQLIGDATMPQLQEKLPGRSANAIRLRANLTHGVRVAQGSVSANELARRIGWDPKQLASARRALRQRWRRFRGGSGGRGAKYLITPTQQRNLLRYLMEGQ